MKKFLALFVSLIMSVSLAACSKTGKYSVLEIKKYDNLSGAKHKSEITLDIEEYTNRSASDYEVVNVRYLKIPKYKALYDLEFVRKIDGTNTSDKAYIGVSVFGDVVSHLFVSLGEMADAKLPTTDEMQKIKENIYTKLEAKYASAAKLTESTKLLIYID